MYGFCTYKQCTNYTRPIPLKRLCMFFVHRNNIKTKQNLYNELTEMAFLSLLYIQTMYKLYKINTNLNWIIYAAADVCFLYIQKLYILYFSNFCINNETTPFYFATLWNFKTNLSTFKKVQRWIYIINLFSINLIYFRFNIYTFFIYIL